MNKYITFLLSSTLLFSCVEKAKPTEHTSYSYFYTKDHTLDTLPGKHPTYKALVSGDSIAFFESGILVHRERFGLTKNGIYILRGNDSLPLYSFNVEEMVYRDTSLIYFFYKDAKLLEKKNYTIDGKTFNIYHFKEGGWDETLDSYYMEGEGFICFYQYANDYFLYLNSINAKEVSPVFLTDTSFFALLQMREMDKKIGRKFDE